MGAFEIPIAPRDHPPRDRALSPESQHGAAHPLVLLHLVPRGAGAVFRSQPADLGDQLWPLRDHRFALYINTTRSGPKQVSIGFWPTVRLFMMPFCVSSFAALVKGRGFVLIFSPDWREIAAAVGLCAGLVLASTLAKRTGGAIGAGGD
jgi:hypothetical protein